MKIILIILKFYRRLLFRHAILGNGKIVEEEEKKQKKRFWMYVKLNTESEEHGEFHTLFPGKKTKLFLPHRAKEHR